jgi:hypothetical protein
LVSFLLSIACSNFTNRTKSNTDSHDSVEFTFDKITEYLIDSIPEIEQFEKQIISDSDGAVTIIMRLDRIPDKNSNDPYRNYYCVYVGEDHKEYTVRWHSVFVSYDMKEILIDDVVTGEVLTLEQWRKSR